MLPWGRQAMAASRALCGFLNVDKPAGLTSHDVVHRVRRRSGVRRVGHTGTLDPFATGVLVVCLGQATRLAEFLADAEKEYVAVVALGRSTDTYDRTGEVVSEGDASSVSQGEVEAALMRFRGLIWQTPPAFSALKRGGVPAYRLARAGQAVQLEPRPVEIRTLTLTAWQPPQVILQLTCSAGTYVRSLAHDLGQVLGCGAHLAELTRLRSGRFALTEAIPLQTLLEAEPWPAWQPWLHPLTAAVPELPAVRLEPAEVQRLVQGQAVPRQGGEGGPTAELVQVLGPDGALAALARPDDTGDNWLPHKVFAGS
ncbi:MAG: tRNA pseudouridine(55) synthase TruB [Chloroflexi bacterium]|nr:tRNA pseudouridine(55) synthase TruB [Chloroflexota bacterium]